MFSPESTISCISEEVLPFKCKRIPEFFLKKAESELNDTPERRTQGLREIKKLINGDKLTKDSEFDDDFLLQFLRAKKYNVSKAFTCLKARINLNKTYSEMFNDFSSEGIPQAVSKNILKILPWRCQDGCTILVFQFDNWDPDTISFHDIRRAIVLFILNAFQEPMTQINGFKIIVDVKINPIKHLRYATPANLYLFCHATQECIPARIQQIHFVNESLMFKAVWLVLKTFLPEKMKKRVYFHSSNEALLKFFPKSVLPKDFGGDLKNSAKYDWLDSSCQCYY